MTAHEREIKSVLDRRMAEDAINRLFPMPYYKLRCIDCNIDFSPLRSTLPEELLTPDYDDTSGGTINMERLYDFHHRDHPGHRKEAIVDAE